MNTFQKLTSLCLLSVAITCQSQDSIPIPANFVYDGIRPISSTIVRELSKYQSRSVSFMGWAPVTKLPLFRTKTGEYNQLYTINAPQAKPVVLTQQNWGILNGSFHPLDTSKLVFVADSAGTGMTQLFLYDDKKKSATRITKPATRNLDFVWSKKGNLLAYRSLGRNGSKRQVYVINPKSLSDEKLLFEADGGNWFPVDFSTDDAQLLVIESRSVAERYLWLVNILTGEKRLLTPRDEKISLEGASFSPGGKEVYILSDWKNDFIYLGRIQLSETAFNVTPLVSSESAGVDNFKISPDGKYIAYLLNEAGVSRLDVLNLRNLSKMYIPTVPIGVITDLYWSMDSRTIGFSLESSNSPADIYSFDIGGRKAVVQWHQSATGDVDLSGLPAANLIRWKSFDGLSISGFLYKPSKQFKGKRPVIINIHGGPELQARPGFLGGRDNYFLNEMGIAILFPNIRGSSGYGKNYLGLDNGLNRTNAFKDIGALLQWIKTQPDLDSSRVMITGVSYGAGVTLAVSYLYSESIRCSWAGAPTSNYNTLLKARPDRRPEYGDERDPTFASFFDEIAPRNHASKFKKPVFLLVGANDPNTPPTEGDEMLAALKQQGSTVWYLKALDEGHGFTKKANLEIATYLTVEFVKQFLVNK